MPDEKYVSFRVVRDDSPNSLRAALSQTQNHWRRGSTAYEQQLQDRGLIEDTDGVWSLPPVDLDRTE